MAAKSDSNRFAAFRSKPAPTTDVEKGETPGTEDGQPASDAPAPSQAVLRGQKRMQQTQAQVDEVTEIMRFVSNRPVIDKSFAY